jgi:hypothetical protein
MSLGSHHAGGLAGFLGHGTGGKAIIHQLPCFFSSAPSSFHALPSCRSIALEKLEPPCPGPSPSALACALASSTSFKRVACAKQRYADSGGALGCLQRRSPASIESGGGGSQAGRVGGREDSAMGSRGAGQTANARARGRAGARARGALGPDLFRLLGFGWLRFAARLLRFKGVGRRLRRKQ